MNWRREFSRDFAIPAAVSERLLDTSWHNDACPSFCHPDFNDGSPRYRLWIEHPDPDQREMSGNARFLVGDMSTDDPSGVLFESETDYDTAIQIILDRGPVVLED